MCIGIGSDCLTLEKILPFPLSGPGISIDSFTACDIMLGVDFQTFLLLWLKSLSSYFNPGNESKAHYTTLVKLCKLSLLSDRRSPKSRVWENCIEHRRQWGLYSQTNTKTCKARSFQGLGSPEVFWLCGNFAEHFQVFGQSILLGCRLGYRVLDMSNSRKDLVKTWSNPSFTEHRHEHILTL